MSLWGRIGRAVKRLVTAPVRRQTRDDDSQVSGRGGFGSSGDDFDRGDIDRGDDERSRLPDGWVLVGLYHEGEQTKRVFATGDTEVTDSEIQNADALIVWDENAGADGYRWIHGANGWDSLYDLIDFTISVVSPTGRGE